MAEPDNTPTALAPKPPEKHLRRREVEALTGLSRSSLYAAMAQGRFPRPVRVSSRAVRWPESVLAAWLAERTVVNDGISRR